MESGPSRRTFNFRMLVRGKDGEPAGDEDVHCVGYIDQWMRKETEHQKQSQTQGQRCKSLYWLLKILMDSISLIKFQS